MTTYANSLVQNEAASSFLQLATTETGGRAFLGDAEKHSPRAAPYITSANLALRNAATKVVALASDETRTEVARHEAAKTLADKTVEQIEKAKASLIATADVMHREADEESDAAFAPRAGYDSLYAEIRTWVREVAKSPDGTGLAKIREALADGSETSKHVAAAIWHSPQFLLAVAKTNHETLRMEVLQKFAPDTYNKLADSVSLRGLPKKYDEAIRLVHSNFYNGALAAKAASRVSV